MADDFYLTEPKAGVRVCITTETMKMTCSILTIPCDDTPAPNSQARVTPLARAALTAGVSFDDVQAYCEGAHVRDPELVAAWYEALVEPPAVCGASGAVPFENLTDALRECCSSMYTDTVLEGALARSARALVEGKDLQAARLWWQGVL